MSEAYPTKIEEVEEEITEDEERLKNGGRKGHGEDGTYYGDSHTQSRHVKGILLSLRKPSYTLARGSVKIRAKNRARLRYLMSRLVRQQNWDEAAAVLSVLLKGTCKEKSPATNRSKYCNAMELLKHLEGYSLNSTRIQRIYDIWMKRIGSMKNWPVKDRFVVQSEFILFSLGQGNVEDAHQAAICLMQEREFGSDPISNMVVGLTFCELWYSVIPKELRSRVSDEPYSPIQSEVSGMSHDDSVENSEGNDAVDFHENGASFEADSDTSVRIDKDIAYGFNTDESTGVSMDVDDGPHENTNQKQSRSFYMNSVEDSGEESSSFSNHADNVQYASSFNGHGFDSWLMPLQLSRSNKNLENYMYSQRGVLNDYYKGAVQHLRAALYSSPPLYEALLPLVQMLLLGNHIDEALNELEKFGHRSEMVLPLRAKASLLEHVDSGNSNKLAACFEDILMKDPTCGHSLSKLISLHHRGEYSPYQLIEMIASHLDATPGESSTWRELGSCFMKLCRCEEDRMSVCLNGNGCEIKEGYSVRFNRVPELFTKGMSGKSWKLRCRWWLTRHFSPTILRSEIEAGDSQHLAYKAASACHMYGHKFEYVLKVCDYLRDEYRDLFLFLQTHMQNSIGFYSNFDK